MTGVIRGGGLHGVVVWGLLGLCDPVEGIGQWWGSFGGAVQGQGALVLDPACTRSGARRGAVHQPTRPPLPPPDIPPGGAAALLEID